MESVNDVRMEEAILTEGEPSSKLIEGDVEFRDVVSISDSLAVDFVNGLNISTLLKNALMIDEDALIQGNIEFTSGISIDGNIEVNETVNSCDLRNVTQMDFTDGTDETNEEIRNSLEKEVALLSNLTTTMKKSLIFMYLKEAVRVDLHLPNIHGSAANRYNDSIEFNVYGMNFGNCGLPSDCYCPSQTNLLVKALEPTHLELQPNSTRFFKYHDEELRVELKVDTETVSYSSRCKRRDEGVVDESTSISWRKFDDGSQQVFTQRLFKGFLSDVKFFRLGDSVYVVMAFYFHPARNHTHNLKTVVYELRVGQGLIEKVDEIPSSGAQVLDVLWTPRGVVLVVGNSFDSDRFTDSVNSAVYRFNEFSNKFELLRHVKTHGVLSIKSTRHKDASFIFFVQKQTWPILILKYNPEYDNFYFTQKLDTAQSNFLSVSIISTSSEDYVGDLFVGIVLSDDTFRFFKYKYIEGFVEESYQEQNNVRILHPFWLGSTQYLLAGAASDVTKIYKLVEQGR